MVNLQQVFCALTILAIVGAFLTTKWSQPNYYYNSNSVHYQVVHPAGANSNAHAKRLHDVGKGRKTDRLYSTSISQESTSSHDDDSVLATSPAKQETASLPDKEKATTGLPGKQETASLPDKEIATTGLPGKQRTPPPGSGCKEIGHTPFDDLNRSKTFISVLENYKHFHRTQLQKLKNMSAQLDATGTRDLAVEEVRTLTWSCDHPGTCSGVGDQLYRIQFAFLLAVVSDRVFTIYWNEENAKTMQYLKPNEIDWRFYDERLGMHKEHNLQVSSWPNFTTNHFVTLAQLLSSEELHITTTHELHILHNFGMVACSDYIKKGFLHMGITSDGDLEDPSVGGQILRYLFQFSAEVISRVEEAERQIGLSSHNYLAIHLRTGFVGTNYEENGSDRKMFKKSNWKQILECSLKRADEVVGHNSSVYLATDSYVAKEWAVQYSQRVKVINMRLQHVAIQKSWSDTDSSPDTENGYLAMWIDFLLLARAHVLVKGISSFSSNVVKFCTIPSTRQLLIYKC